VTIQPRKRTSRTRGICRAFGLILLISTSHWPALAQDKPALQTQIVLLGTGTPHSLTHVKGTLASGHITNLWVRWTACFRRIDGVWLVVHDHASVPADLEHGEAILNLTP